MSARWCVNNSMHVNHKVNAMIADEIYEHICLGLDRELTDREEISKDIAIMGKAYVEMFFADFDRSAYERIGAIVMNCNPFTNGHRYLIEQALKTVDFLIIFVVEEDKSVFPFEVRMACVKEGVADLKNVMVVPSGDLILSQRTFPEYFVKIADEDIVKNVEYDITLFAEQIAPELGITHRFVGEEPTDGVTREYNEAMKRILPAHGIELIEIPRKEIEGRVISATTVRKCLETGDLESLDMLIPETTKRILYWENK